MYNYKASHSVFNMVSQGFQPLRDLVQGLDVILVVYKMVFGPLSENNDQK